MRIHSIYLQEYRVLKEFSLRFQHESGLPEALEGSGQYALDLLVGVNGTGKSSLLRAIAEIFRRLEDPGARDHFPFGFEITYQMVENSPYICITNLEDSTEQTPRRLPEGTWRIGRGERLENIPLKPVKSDQWSQEIESNELPSLTVAFTTGSEREWELVAEAVGNQQSEETTIELPTDKDGLAEWFLKEVPGELVEENGESVVSPEFPLHTEHFLFIKEQYFPLVILCSLLDDMTESRPAGRKSRLQKVLDACNIKVLHGFSLKFRMNKAALLPRDKEFVRDLAALAGSDAVQRGADYLLVFDLENIHPRLAEFLAKSGGSLGLFKELVRLYEPQGDIPPILREVNLFIERGRSTEAERDERRTVQRREPSPLHLLDWLSDGERSFLGRLCLLSLLGSSRSEALILIDEPEVHFNDYWKRQLVAMIDSALELQNSHVLMTTHSSITLSDVLNRNIWVLRRSGDYTSSAPSPVLSTLGTDPSDIMVYIFDAENAVGAQGTTFIERELMRIAHITGETLEQVNEQKRAKLRDLLKQVGPGDWSFLIRRELHALGE